MISGSITIAQAAPEVPDPTLGQILSGMAVLGVIACSLIMCSLWLARWRHGIELIPRAARKPLCVPLPLLFCGLALSVLMAGLAALGGEDIADEADTSISDKDAAANVVEQKQQIREMMLGNINANLIVLMIFGTAIWATQKHRSRQVQNMEDVDYPLLNFPQQYSQHPTVFDGFRDIDSESFTSPDTGNDLTNRIELDKQAENISQGVNATVGSELPEIETWSFLTELRFAVETFFVAYFPTTAIRIAIVSALPDAPSHPFLQLLDEGVDWDIMLLICLMAVIVAPVVEELLFRVTLLGGTLQRGHYVLGWIVSSVLFGMAHGFPDCIALLPLAFAIGYLYSQRRSYRSAILVHFMFNAFNMLLAGLSML